MSQYNITKGSIKAQKAAQKKVKPVMNAATQSGFGYLVGQMGSKLKVAKNAVLAVAIGASGMFLSSCASSSTMGAYNMVTTHGTNRVAYTYTPSGQLASKTTSYQEYNALDAARVEREYARSNAENARAFKTSAQGIKELGKGIKSLREAFKGM